MPPSPTSVVVDIQTSSYHELALVVPVPSLAVVQVIVTGLAGLQSRWGRDLRDHEVGQRLVDRHGHRCRAVVGVVALVDGVGRLVGGRVDRRGIGGDEEVIGPGQRDRDRHRLGGRVRLARVQEAIVSERSQEYRRGEVGRGRGEDFVVPGGGDGVACPLVGDGPRQGRRWSRPGAVPVP